MSQHPQNFDPNRIPRVTPIQPLNTPEPLGYATPAVQSRPGMVSAIGICSIVMGALGILSSGLLALILIFAITAVVSTRRSVTPGPVIVSGSGGAVVTHPETAVDDDPESQAGLSRRRLIDVLASMQHLSQKQKDMLFALLREHERKIISIDPAALPDESLNSLVSSSSTSPDARGRTVVDFELANGRLEVLADDAVFYPLGNEQPLRASEIKPPPTALSESGVQAVLDHVNEILKSQQVKPTEQQINALKAELSKPDQRLVDTSLLQPGVGPAEMVRMAMLDPARSSLQVIFVNRQIEIQSDGQLLRNTPPSMVSPNVFSRPLNPLPTLSAFGIAVLSLALNIFLLVIGILTLQGSYRSRSLHLIYAGIKIMLTAGMFAAIAWAISDLDSAVRTSRTNAPSIGWSSWLGFFGRVGWFSVWYPVALLIVLQLKSVKAYFHRQ